MQRLKLPKHLVITLNYFNIPKIQFDINKVYNVYTYGSVNYETNTEKSDLDYIIIYDGEIDYTETIISNVGGMTLNATLISIENFQIYLDQHRIDVLECYFLKEDYKHESIKFDFNLNLDQLRRSISAVCSNSFVKCKKKLNQGDDYIGKKSLFHSLRIADFGIQIAKEGKIISYTKPYSDILNYKTYKSLLTEIMNFNTWEELKEKYQKISNNLRTEFRIHAPLK